MGSAMANRGKTTEPRTEEGTDAANRQETANSVGAERGENKVPLEAENIEHTIRRAVREKERQRAKNPGHYL